MDRSYIINYIAKKINAKKYLEIGVDNRVNFNSINVGYKVGVDPETEHPDLVKKTSDEYFENNQEKFDLIFIDGLHHSDQVLRDILNSLDRLNPSGFIICHDMLPTNEHMQLIPFSGGMWTGDCWKAFVDLRKTRDDLQMFTIDTDMGLGIITKGEQKILKTSKEATYENFVHHKYEWMNILSLLSFYKLFEEKDVLKALLNHYIEYPNSPEINFYLGFYYHSIGQTASAVSFYLRAAERTYDDILRYECLLRAGMCFNSQGCRNNSVEGMFQHAVALAPDRPEGYYFLSRFYEQAKKWFNGYMIASIGERVANKKPSKLRTNLDYPGFYALTFEKAVTGWWTGLCNESRRIFEHLAIHEPLDNVHKSAVCSNLKTINGWKRDDQFTSFLKNKDQELESSTQNLSLYLKQDYSSLKYLFSQIESVERNYSEAFQDMFVLTMLEGKKNGTYVELGSGFPFYGNNTYLLEQEYEWKGLSIDIEAESIERYFRDRNNLALRRDALSIDYASLFEETKMPKIIDYLQLDCDPPKVTYDILLKVPFDEYKFAVITYEHDHYNDETKSYKKKSRDYLLSKGYELVVTNVAPKEDKDYEDWYVHPDLVNRNVINKIKNIDDNIKIARDLFL